MLFQVLLVKKASHSALESLLLELELERSLQSNAVCTGRAWADRRASATSLLPRIWSMQVHGLSGGIRTQVSAALVFASAAQAKSV